MLRNVPAPARPESTQAGRANLLGAPVLYLPTIALVRSFHQPLLGTTVTIGVHARWPRSDGRTRAIVVAEIERLMTVFNVFDDASELRRHLHGAPAGPELREVQRLATGWIERTGGAFNPAVDRLRKLWREAEEVAQMPTPDDLSAAVEAIGPGAPTDNLNALAKGWIVDRAVERAMSMRLPPMSLVVEAGGDLVHAGQGSQIVGIENPHRPYDNEPPIDRVEISNQALATSGTARRFFEIDGTRYSHVIDPRTGWPVDRVASVSVIAPNAATADVLATAAMVLGPTEALPLVAHHNANCLLIESTGTQHTTTDWPGTAA